MLLKHRKAKLVNLKIGDTVLHPTLKKGVVAGFDRIGSVLVNFSDKSGVLFRWVHKNRLEVINEI